MNGVSAGELPRLLVEVESKYKGASTLTANFNQTVKVTALKRVKTSSGLLKVHRPDKVRWETVKPDQDLLIADGKTVWMYTPPFDENDNGQLIVRKGSLFSSKLASVLLSGSFSLAKDMTVVQMSPYRFSLVPRRKGKGGVEKAYVEISKKEKLIQKVILHFVTGNITEIDLSNIHLGKTISPKEFTFEPPAGTEIHGKK